MYSLFIKEQMIKKFVLYSVFFLLMLGAFRLGGNSFAETIAECTADCIAGWSGESECYDYCVDKIAEFQPPVVNADEEEIIDEGDEDDNNIPICNVESSPYFKDPNSKIVIPNATCACKKWYGDMPGAKKWEICQLCELEEVCCGVKLNTNVPFIGNCIESSTQAAWSTVTETTAFPILVSALVKILISVILITSFILIVIAGVRWSAGDAKWGKDMIIKVAIGLAILGASGTILALINPNFFK